MKLIQRAEQTLQAISQLVRCRRQCHNRRTDHQINQSDCHSTCQHQTFLCYLNKSQLPYHLTRGKNHIKKYGDQKKHKNSLQTFKNKLHRNLGQKDHSCKKYSSHCISCEGVEQKYRYNKSNGSYQFGSWIQLVNHGICRIILSNGNISDHSLLPPFLRSEGFCFFKASRIVSLASSTVVAVVSTFRPFSESACMI